MSNRSNLLPCLRLLCIAAAGFFATGQAAVAEPQEIKVVEHADTDAVTEPAIRATPPATSSPSPTRCTMPTTRTRWARTRAFASARWSARPGSASGRSPWDKGQITVEGPFPDAGDSGAGDYRRHRRLCRRHGRHGAESARHRRQGLRFHLQNQIVAARAKPYRAKRHRLNTPVAYRLQLRPKARGAGELMGIRAELDATSSVLVINAPFSGVTGGVSKLRSRVLGEWPTRRNVAAGRSWPRLARAPMRQKPRWRGLLFT